MPLFGPPNIEKLKANGRIDDLIKALSYQRNPQVRRDAVAALMVITEADEESIYSEKVEQALMDVLVDEDKQVQYLAINALKHIAGPMLLTSLLEDLIAGEKKHRETAVKLLIEFKDPRVVMTLNEILQKGAPAAQENALKVFLGYEDPRIAEFLIPLLEDKNQNIRVAAAEKLGSLGNPEAVAPLGRALKKAWKESENSSHTQIERKQYKNECKKIVLSLWHTGHPRAVTPLLSVLKSTKSYEIDFRALIICALGKVGDQTVVEVLIGFLTGGNIPEKLAAIEALEAIGHQAAVPSLVKKLEDPNKNTRQSAARALHSIYRSGKLSTENKKLILDARRTIANQHIDNNKTHVDTDEYHTDKMCFEDLHSDGWEKSAHSDYEGTGRHTDQGIGIEFPL